MFRTNVVDEIKKYFMFNNFFLNRAIYEAMWKKSLRAGEATDDNMVHFYIDGSVHLNSILIRSNKMQQYAGIYLL
jgi:hypothetical protein